LKINLSINYSRINNFVKINPNLLNKIMTKAGIVSEKKIKEITKRIIKDSIKGWRKKKEIRGIDTSHFVLNLISPYERLVSAVIQSCQTSLGTKFWENLIKEIAHENSFEICDNKDFFQPNTNELNYIIDQWKTKREENKTPVSLEGYKKELIKEIKINSEKFRNVKKIKPKKGDGLDISLKKNNTHYLFEIKSPHVNAGAGKDYSLKLMKMYHHHLFWEPDSKVIVQIIFPYNPFEVDYDVAQKGRIDPLIRNLDYLVADDFWKFLSGNDNCMKYLKEAIIEANTEFNLYEDIKYFIDKHK
jgi:hypothetical protein